MKKIISLFLVLTLILSLCISSAAASDTIINLNYENAEDRIAENVSSDTIVNVVVFPDYPGPDFTENNAALFEKIASVIPSARRDSKYRQDRSSMIITMPAGEFTKLRDIEGIYDAELFVPDKITVNEDGTVDILIVYGYSMTADQQKEYNDADWSEKIGMLEKLYEQSKIDLMDGIGAICEYQVLRDTSINRIYLRVPQSAVENIKQVQYVRSVSYRTLSESKLNDGAQKLVAESDPGQIVSVLVWTDRGDVVCIRDFLNMTKQEFNTIRVIEDENGVTAHRKINHAYYNAFNQRLISEITAETKAVYKPHITYHPEDDTYSEVEADMFLRFDIAVGQLEALSRIDGVTGITYEAPAQPDPYQDWYYLGGDQDLLHKLLGEPNEMGAYYIPQGMSIAFGKADEAEYARFKEIDYVKGVKYCRPAPSDGWWKLEGDENLLKATYGEPNEDGRYYVPKKEAVKGDVDYDYSLTVVDATGIQRELAELSAEHFNAGAADYDDDGYMSVLDATAIQRTLAE